jgi:hypothetical protein
MHPNEFAGHFVNPKHVTWIGPVVNTAFYVGFAGEPGGLHLKFDESDGAQRERDRLIQMVALTS